MPFDEAPDLWRRLGETTVDIHAICAERDNIVPGAAAAKFLVGVLGDRLSSLQLLEEHGHALPYEVPDECAAMLLQIWKQRKD